MGRLTRMRAWCRRHQVVTHIVAHAIAAPLVLAAAWLLGFWPVDDAGDENLPTLEEAAERCQRNPDYCDEPIETQGGILYIPAE
jgi:hypothetical protein